MMAGKIVKIGLEIHVQLNTSSKMFCSCPTDFAAPANTSTCPVCLGWPGTLPSLNKNAVELGLQTALALRCRIQQVSQFDRKNYFYPDLPKGYQITQHFRPLGLDGEMNIKNRRIKINRVHLEEDAGKTVDQNGEALIDYNRAGIPLVEIVTGPDISSPEEAREFLKELRLLLLYGNISDCSMEEGSLRCDANISLAFTNSGNNGGRVELKNLNSFQALSRALQYEIERQTDILDRDGLISPETRGWEEQEQKTYFLRSKESGEDYRYFPDPDLPSLYLDEKEIKRVEEEVPESPASRIQRWQEDLGLEEEECRFLISRKDRAWLFEEVAFLTSPREVARWIKENLAGKKNLDRFPPQFLAETIKMVENGSLNSTQGKEVLELSFQQKKDPAEIVREKGWEQISQPEYIEDLVLQVLEENPEAVKDFLEGKERALRHLMGKAMERSRGQANPEMVRKELQKKLREQQRNE